MNRVVITLQTRDGADDGGGSAQIEEGVAAGEVDWRRFVRRRCRWCRRGGRRSNQLHGKRVSTTYLGEIAEHLVELSNGQRVKAFELNPQLSRTGTAEAGTIA